MNIKSCINAGLYLTKKYTPQIAMTVSTLAGLGAIIWASKNSYEKLPDIMQEYENEIEDIDANEYLTVKEKAKARHKVARHTFGRLSKCYAGPATLEAISIAARWFGWKVQHNRTSEAIAYGAGLATILKDYRQGVKERYGEDVDKELYYGMKDATIEKTVTDDKGREKKVKENVKVANGKTSGLRRYITPTNPHYYGGDLLHVKDFASRTSSLFTERLQHIDYNVLPLNDIFEYMLLEKSAEGMTNGLFYDYHNPDLLNKVTIEITETYLPDSEGNLVKVFAVDIPIDGNIYEMRAGLEGK